MADIRVNLILNSSSYTKGMKSASKGNDDFSKSGVNAAKTIIRDLSDVEKAAAKAGKEMQKRLSGKSNYNAGAAESLITRLFGYDAQKAQDKFNKSAIAAAENTARKQATAKLREYKKGLALEEAAFNKSEKARLNAWLKQTSALNAPRQQSPILGDDFESQAPRIRYALYDVGQRALATGAAIAGIGVAAVTTAAKFESAFTAVERTSGLTGARLESLRQQLIEISTTIPVAFEDVAAIATLGAQMGIAADSLDEFTTTVAKFSAITGISVEQTAQSFGRLAQLMNVPVSQFENLSSAITFAGINAVATDKEIITMAESIAAAGTQAGLSADEVIGFSTALSSLKVRPEEARGVLVRLFRTIDLSVSQGGEQLQNFAKVVGQTTDETANLWKQDPSAFVQALLSGAQAGGQLNQVITDLGITNSRELNVIQRLAGNMDVLTSSLADSRDQFLLGSYASEAYAKRADDLQSRLQVMMQTIEALIASVGKPLADALSPIIGAITNILNVFKNVDPVISSLVIALAAAVGGFLLVKGAIALTIAGLLAFKTALSGLQNNLGGLGINAKTVSILMKDLGGSLIFSGSAATGATAKYAGMTSALTGVGLSARAATVATRGLSIALGPVGIILGIAAAVLPSFVAGLSDTADESNKAGKAMFEAAGGASAFMDAVAKDTEAGAEAYRKVAAGVDAYTKSEKEAKNAAYDAAIAKYKSLSATEENLAAIKDLEIAQQKFNDELARGNELTADNTALLGDNTLEVLLNGLSKYNDNGDDFWLQFSSLSPTAKGALEALGFDAGAMVKAGLAKEGGAEEYAQTFQDAIDTVFTSSDGYNAVPLETLRNQLANLGFDLTIKQVEELQKSVFKTGFETKDFAKSTVEASKATDGSIKSTIAAVKATELKGETFKAAGLEADGETEAVESLSDALRRYGKEATSVQDATVGIYNSFANMATSFAEVDGEITNLTQGGRDAIGAWSSFMQESIDNAVANDTGFVGSITTMAAAIYAMGAEGLNTGYQFDTMKQYIIKSMASSVPALSGFASTLSSAMDTTEVLAMIDAQIALSKAIARVKGINGADNTTELEAIKYLEALRNGLKASGNESKNFSSVFADAMKKAEKSTGKVLTAFEALKALIESAFKYTNLYADVQESLNSLGKSLSENGKQFTIYSEAGRSNISALGNVIDALAAKSGGNITKFSNDLASLRAALVKAGAPASALKVIDNVTKQIGKTGKASAKDVKQFEAAIKKVGETKRELYAVKDAMDAIASGLRKGFEAVFAQGDAIDSVTLGWLDMADAADKANKSIEDAGKTIRDAKLEIQDIGAEIDKLSADKGKLEYQLSIALKYGDTLRANEIRADIAKIDADVADKQASILDANSTIADANKQIAEAQGVLGNNPSIRQQIERNNALRDMALKYGDVAASMIAAAKPGDDLNKIVDEQVTAFYNSALQMGYSEDDAKSMADTLRDELIYQMNQIPKDITTDIKAETSVATKAVNDFVSHANARLQQIKDKTITVTTRYVSQTQVPTSTKYGGGGGGFIAMSTGGLVTGPGSATSDSIGARLSNGEYVVKAAAVSKYGVDFFNSLNQMKTAPAGMSSGVVQQQSGGGMVYLSPEDRQLLRAAIDRPIALYTDNATIATSANNGNKILAQRGIR